MRAVGLLLLAIFFPAFASADDSPTLTTYTVSHDTVYPTATTESGLATTTVIDVAFSEPVKTSIKILSVDGSTIKSLYTSSSVTNPMPKVWDGTNNASTRVDDGTYTILISATSIATSLTITDSSKTISVASSGGSAPEEPPPETSPEATSTPSAVTVSTYGGGPTEYLPIPSLRIIAGGARTVSSGADVAFTAAVYDGKGNKRDDAVVTWSFGDGMRRTGASVFHAYYEPGEYLAVVRATTLDGGDVRSEIVITVKNAGIKITSVSPRGITLANSDSRALDLSQWRLAMGGQEFRIPADTYILAGRTILFPTQVIQLPIANTASLLYPGGEVAAAYPASAPVQPAPRVVSYEKVQTVEPIISTRTNVQNAQEAAAPREIGEDALSRGAALPLAAVAALAPEPESRAPGLFRSPWVLGFLGVVALAGSAFIFL